MANSVEENSPDEDPITEAIEEHADFNPEIPVGAAQEEVEEQTTEERLDQQFQAPGEIENPEQTRSEDHQYMRNITFVAGKDEVDLDPNGDLEKAEQAKERLQEIEMVNEELKRSGSARRYIVNGSDAPDNAHVYDDAFGKYYYEEFDTGLRPSDVAKYADVQAWPVLGEDEQVIKTIEMLNQFSGEPLADADTEKAARSWLHRHMVTPEDDVGDDVFDPDTVKMVAGAVAAATVEGDSGNLSEDGST